MTKGDLLRFLTPFIYEIPIILRVDGKDLRLAVSYECPGGDGRIVLAALPPEVAAPISLAVTSGHGRTVCSCGKVVAQCRCPGPHSPDRVLLHPACEREPRA